MAASSATFGPQWPQTNPNIVTLVRKDGLRIPLHRELVSLVSILMDLTEALGYDIIPGWTWGYANRPISGTTTPSNHSRGCAVDINAPVNPYASAAWHLRNANAKPFGLPRRTDIPQQVFELWENHGFALGVRYASKPDPMHFEFVESVTECRRITANLIKFLGHPAAALPKPKPTAPATPEDDMPVAPPFELWRDSRNNNLWKVDSNHIHRRKILTTAIKNAEIYHLASLGFSPAERVCDTDEEQDWLDSLAIV